MSEAIVETTRGRVRGLNAGLFHRAILQAGAMSALGPIGAYAPAAASELSERYLHELGLTGADIDKIQDISLGELVRADSALSPSLTTRRPVVDGTVLSQSPSVAAAEGRLAQFPVIVGSCRYEMDVLASNPGVNRMAAIPADHRQRLLRLYRANRAGSLTGRRSSPC
jgi:carboxylesterase type B